MIVVLGWLFLAFYVAPVSISAGMYYFHTRRADWRSAERSSSGLLPDARATPDAVIGILSARTVMWRGIVATHAWVVIKDAGAAAYQRFDYTAWGTPIWVDRFVPDARWFGSTPDIVYLARGATAEAVIPQARQAIKNYRYSNRGDYHLWPGPNSNTFVAAVMQAAKLPATLPPTAVGKDFPYDGRWFGLTPSGTGVRLNFGGYFGLSVGWIEGVEINVLGAVAGVDIRRPGLKFPALGRIGV